MMAESITQMQACNGLFFYLLKQKVARVASCSIHLDLTVVSFTG